MPSTTEETVSKWVCLHYTQAPEERERITPKCKSVVETLKRVDSAVLE